MSSIPTQPPIGQSITAPGSEREGDGTVPPPSPSRSLPAILPNATVIVDNVSKSFGSLVAVSDVTFSVGPGVTALLGPNGAGKSTLLRVLCGLTPPSTGAIQVNGGNPRTEGWARRSIGLVPQQDGVFERDSLYDFVHLSAVLNGVPDPDAAVRVALDAVELAPDLDRPLGAFSKGMRQRAKIAAALVHRPSVMVLDEPLNGLDPKQRRQMITLFHQLGEDGYTVLVSSHVLDEVERFGSRVLVIAKGRLAAQGDFRAIRALMNDQPLTYRISCSDPRSTAAELIREGMVTGCTVTGAETVEITTADAAGFRHRLPAICSTNGIRLEELSPLDADLESVFRYLVGALTMTDNLDMPDTLNVSRTATGPAAPMQQRGPTVDHNVKTPGAFLALYRLVLRHQITRGRLVLFAVIGAISVALGWVIGRSGGNIIQDSTDFVSLFGLGLIVPVVALVLGSAALGTWVEDETLVYIWLRPVKRWVVALAATLASATVAVPVTVASMGAMAALGSKGDGGVIGGAVLASALGSLAYVALFVLAGLLVKRALLWGLVYVFIWEFFVARAGAGAARLSINSYAASILSRQSGIDIRLADRGLTTSYIVLGAVSLVAIALTTWRLSRANVA